MEGLLSGRHLTLVGRFGAGVAWCPFLALSALCCARFGPGRSALATVVLGLAVFALGYGLFFRGWLLPQAGLDLGLILLWAGANAMNKHIALFPTTPPIVLSWEDEPPSATARLLTAGDRFLCAQCGAEITNASLRVAVDGAHRHLLPRSFGLDQEHGCFSLAPGCAVHAGQHRQPAPF